MTKCKTKVVVLLSAPSGYANVYFDTKKQATDYIESWRDRARQRIADGNMNVETALYFSSEDSCEFALLAQYIIGMYIPQDNDYQSRIASSMEKIAKSQDVGEEWRENNNE